MLDRTSHLPLYIQIRRKLRATIQELIREGRKEFPSDDELARTFGVSRMTVRQAVSDLVDEGLLVRVRGAGTYITSGKITEQISPISDFLGRMGLQGKTGTTKLLSFEKRPCPASIAPTLRVSEGDDIYYLLRKRFVDDQIIAIDHRYFPSSIGQHLSREQLEGTAIHAALAPYLESPIATAHIEVEAAPATQAEAVELDMPKATPLLVKATTVYSRAGETLWTGKTRYRSDYYKIGMQIPLEYAEAQLAIAPSGDNSSVDSTGDVAYGRFEEW